MVASPETTGLETVDTDIFRKNKELSDCYSAIVGLETQILAFQQRLHFHNDKENRRPRSNSQACLDIMLEMLAKEQTRCSILEQSVCNMQNLDVSSNRQVHRIVQPEALFNESGVVAHGENATDEGSWFEARRRPVSRPNNTKTPKTRSTLQKQVPSARAWLRASGTVFCHWTDEKLSHVRDGEEEDVKVSPLFSMSNPCTPSLQPQELNRPSLASLASTMTSLSTNVPSEHFDHLDLQMQDGQMDRATVASDTDSLPTRFAARLPETEHETFKPHLIHRMVTQNENQGADANEQIWNSQASSVLGSDFESGDSRTELDFKVMAAEDLVCKAFSELGLPDFRADTASQEPSDSVLRKDACEFEDMKSSEIDCIKDDLDGDRTLAQKLLEEARVTGKEPFGDSASNGQRHEYPRELQDDVSTDKATRAFAGYSFQDALKELRLFQDVLGAEKDYLSNRAQINRDEEEKKVEFERDDRFADASEAASLLTAWILAPAAAYSSASMAAAAAEAATQFQLPPPPPLAPRRRTDVELKQEGKQGMEHCIWAASNREMSQCTTTSARNVAVQTEGQEWEKGSAKNDTRSMDETDGATSLDKSRNTSNQGREGERGSDLNLDHGLDQENCHAPIFLAPQARALQRHLNEKMRPNSIPIRTSGEMNSSLPFKGACQSMPSVVTWYMQISRCGGAVRGPGKSSSKSQALGKSVSPISISYSKRSNYNSSESNVMYSSVTESEQSDDDDDDDAQSSPVLHRQDSRSISFTPAQDDHVSSCEGDEGGDESSLEESLLSLPLKVEGTTIRHFPGSLALTQHLATPASQRRRGRHSSARKLSPEERRAPRDELKGFEPCVPLHAQTEDAAQLVKNVAAFCGGGLEREQTKGDLSKTKHHDWLIRVICPTKSATGGHDGPANDYLPSVSIIRTMSALSDMDGEAEERDNIGIRDDRAGTVNVMVGEEVCENVTENALQKLQKDFATRLLVAGFTMEETLDDYRGHIERLQKERSLLQDQLNDSLREQREQEIGLGGIYRTSSLLEEVQDHTEKTSNSSRLECVLEEVEDYHILEEETTRKVQNGECKDDAQQTTIQEAGVDGDACEEELSLDYESRLQVMSLLVKRGEGEAVLSVLDDIHVYTDEHNMLTPVGEVQEEILQGLEEQGTGGADCSRGQGAGILTVTPISPSSLLPVPSRPPPLSPRDLRIIKESMIMPLSSSSGNARIRGLAYVHTLVREGEEFDALDRPQQQRGQGGIARGVSGGRGSVRIQQKKSSVFSRNPRKMLRKIISRVRARSAN